LLSRVSFSVTLTQIRAQPPADQTHSSGTAWKLGCKAGPADSPAFMTQSHTSFSIRA